MKKACNLESEVTPEQTIEFKIVWGFLTAVLFCLSAVCCYVAFLIGNYIYNTPLGLVGVVMYTPFAVWFLAFPVFAFIQFCFWNQLHKGEEQNGK